jgi:2-iminobutanoate/2-iminopropanoate deaminase
MIETIIMVQSQVDTTGGTAMPEIIHTQNVPSSPFYSQAVKAGGLVFVSGTFPADAVTGEIVGDTIAEQTAQCLRNISAILETAGTSLEKAVSATVIFAPNPDFAAFNAEWARWFPNHRPARQGATLPIVVPRMLLSVAMVVEA